MMHHVRRANFRVKTQQNGLAPDDRQRWQSWFESSFSQVLETVLEEWRLEQASDADTQTIDIQHLHIDLGTLQLNTPLDQLYASLRRQLFAQLNDSQPRFISADTSVFETYTHFLEHGIWKPGTDTTQWQSIETWFLEHPESFQKIYRLLQNTHIKKSLWPRFFLQHSAEFIERFVNDSLSREMVTTLEKHEFIQSLAYRAKALLWCYAAKDGESHYKKLDLWLQMNVAKIASQWSQIPEYLQVHHVQEWLAEASETIKNVAVDNDQTPASEATPSADSKLVEHAGIVLLHPFLDAFFNKFGWLDEQGEIKQDQQSLALFALLYMATGRASAVEPDLLLFKVLLGMPIDYPVANEIQLSQDVKQECEVLLQALIKHWSALKNTSIDGLRQGFIQRAGSLYVDADGNRLHIEKKSMDILLDRLPWSINFLAFRWMKKPLFVDWAG